MADKSKCLQAILALVFIASAELYGHLAPFEGINMSQAQGADSGYTYSVEQDSETGWKVYQLSFRDPKNPDKPGETTTGMVRIRVHPRIVRVPF